MLTHALALEWGPRVRVNQVTVGLVAARWIRTDLNRIAAAYRLKLDVDNLPVHAEWVCDSGDEWKATHLIFRLEAANSGTLLRFTHAGWKGETDYFVACTTTWGELMYRLKAVAEGKRPGPLFRMAEMAY